MISKNLHDNFNIEQSCEYYLAINYTELNVSTPLGTRVFLDQDGGTIIRIGHDEGYDIFASSVKNGGLVLTNAVTIHDHYKVKRSEDVFYTITEMERLDELSNQEASAFETWRSITEGNLNKVGGLTDPFSLLRDFISLYNFINSYNTTILHHDYWQSKNIMKRGSQFVITDPFV